MNFFESVCSISNFSIPLMKKITAPECLFFHVFFVYLVIISDPIQAVNVVNIQFIEHEEWFEVIKCVTTIPEIRVLRSSQTGVFVGITHVPNFR